jgi:hypothetical protein
MELQMRVCGAGSNEARGSFGSYLGGLLRCWVIWNPCAFQCISRDSKDDWALESSRCFAKGFQVSDFAQAVVT